MTLAGRKPGLRAQGQRLADGVHVRAGGPEIETARGGVFQVAGGRFARRDGRQVPGDVPRRGFRVRETEQAVETFAVGTGVGLRLQGIDLRLGGGGLLRVEPQIGDIARVMEPLRQIGGGIVGLGNEAQPFEELLPGLEGVNRRLGVGDEAEGLGGGTAAGAIHLARGHPAAGGQQEKVEEVGRERVLGVGERGSAVGKAEARAELRVTEQARLHEIGLRDADFLEFRLERTVVEHRDARGPVGVERATAQEGGDGLTDARVGGVIAVPAHVHGMAGAPGNLASHALERPVRRGHRTTRQNEDYA